MVVHVALLVVAVWSAWRPAATAPETPIVIAAAVAAAVPWAWRRSRPESVTLRLVALAAVSAFLVASALAGWDIATALEQLALAAAVGTLVWIASREPVPDGPVLCLALALAALALWGAWQVTVGFDAALAGIEDLDPALRDNALERLSGGRAFASLPLPGHLAALLATAVPLLALGVRRRAKGPRKNSFTEFAPRCAADSARPIERNRRCSSAYIDDSVIEDEPKMRCRWDAKTGGRSRAVPEGLTAGAVLCALGLVLCALGLVLSRSPIGIALAATAGAAVVVRRRVAALAAGVVVLLVLLTVVVAARSDVTRLEPLRLRLDNWRTAAWLWTSAPVTGAGLGSYGQASQAVPFGVGNRPQHAHCLPLEWAAELGVVGFAGFLGAAWWLWRLLRALWPRHPELAAAVAVVPVHNLVDFSLYVSAVAVPWAILLGWSLAATRLPSIVPVERRGRAVAVAVAGLAVGIALLHGTSVVVERSAAARQNLARRDRDLRVASRLAPWRVEPVVGQVITALQDGEPSLLDEGAQALTRVRWMRPHSAALASLASQLALARGRVPEALTEAWAAHHQRPFDEGTSRHLELLLRHLDGDER